MKGLKIEKLQVERKSFRLNIGPLEIQPGEVLGVMGKSGSGKTSFLHAIAGFIPSQSIIRVDNHEIQDLPPEKRRTAIVFQKPWLFEHLSILENISFGLKIQGASKLNGESQAREWLSKMEISHLEKKRTWEVSGGEAQRVALARAMAVQFPLLLLDEPFSALDAPLRQGLRKLVKGLVSESQSCAILVSHDWKDIKEVSSRVLVLAEGKVLALEEVSKMKEHSDSEVRAICGE